MQGLDPPSVLVVADGCLSPTHGTGTVVLRHFLGYPPEKLGSAYCGAGSPLWGNSSSFDVRPARLNGIASTCNWLLWLYNAIVWRLGLKLLLYNRALELRPACGEYANPNFVPNLIYSVAYSEGGLALVDHIMRGLPLEVPVLQYFMDYRTSKGFCRTRYLRRVLARATEVWALTEEIADAVRPVAASFGKVVRVQTGFHLQLPSRWKQEHRSPADGNFHCVITGNFWQNAMALVVKRVWRQVQESFPDLGPIEWYCHPESVKRTREAIGSLEPEIYPAGFFTGEDFLNRLTDADLAIVPFDMHRHPENDYARHSLPSRLTELLSVGLPVFCIAGKQTPLAHYITQHNLGDVCDAESEERLVQRLTSFITNDEQRALLGRQARTFAEKEFALGPFQEWLYRHLKMLAFDSVPQFEVNVKLHECCGTD
jgi:hypothetical protein